jgi:hypothetical protein
MKNFTWFCILNVISLGLFSQNKEYIKHFKKGNEYLINQNYIAALECFLSAYKIDSVNANVNFKIASCYSEIPNKKKYAEKYFAVAVTDVTKKYKEDKPGFKQAPYYAYFYFGELLHTLNKLEESKKMFKQYEGYLNKEKKKEDLELLTHFENMVEYAEQKEMYPVRILIKNLGDSINSPFSEYSPVCDGEEKTLIFTYRGERSTGADEGLLTEEGKFFEDIFISTKLESGIWSKAKPINAKINSKEHDASVNLSYDGKTLIIYRDDEGDGNLYYSNRDGENWGDLKKFSSEINSKYWEPSACFSTDMNTIYFVSDKPGGYGGRDLYRCKKLPNGEWSKAVNLGPKINTKYDEDSPFLHSNGKDFYFSSNGHASIGGFDIMVSEMNENEEFGEVFNLPYPINTTEDDLFYFVSSDGKRAYYSSAHSDSLAKGDNDIYLVSLEELNRKDRVFVRGGFLLNETGPTKDSLLISVKNKNTGVLVGEFKPNKQGEFISQISLDSLYEISYLQNGEVTKTEQLNFETRKEIGRFGYEIILAKVPLIERKPDVMVKLKIIGTDGSQVGSASVSIKDSIGVRSFISDSLGFVEKVKFTEGRNYTIAVQKGEDFSQETLLGESKLDGTTRVIKLETKKIVVVDDKKKDDVKTNPKSPADIIRQTNPKNIKFKVQVAAYRKPQNYNWKHLREFGVPDQLKLDDGITRFTYGLFDSFEECEKLLQKIIAKGQRDAWITAVHNGKRYTLNQLVEMNFFIKSEF